MNADQLKQNESREMKPESLFLNSGKDCL